MEVVLPGSTFHVGGSLCTPWASVDIELYTMLFVRTQSIKHGNVMFIVVKLFYIEVRHHYLNLCIIHALTHPHV